MPAISFCLNNDAPELNTMVLSKGQVELKSLVSVLARHIFLLKHLNLLLNHDWLWLLTSFNRRLVSILLDLSDGGDRSFFFFVFFLTAQDSQIGRAHV